MIRRLMRYSASVLALALIAGTLSAQTVTSVSDAMVESALGDLRIAFTKGQEGFAFKIGERPAMLAGVQNGTKLLIKASATAQDAALPVLNRYNEEIAVTTRAVRYAKEGVMLEAGLDCRLGVSPAGL